MPTPVFAALARQWDAIIGTGMTDVVARVVAANAELLVSLLTIYFVLLGAMVSFGRISWSEFVAWMVRGAVVSLLLTATGFATYIQTPVIDTIPRWIASATSGADVRSTPDMFDHLRFGVLMREGQIKQQLGAFDIGQRIEASVLSTINVVIIALTFMIWQLMRGVTAYLVIAAPFLIGFYLFPATRHIAMNWLGTVVSALLAMLFVSIMVSFALAANNAFLDQTLARPAGGGCGLMTPIAGCGVDNLLSDLSATFVFFLFSLIMCLFLPYLAMRMGHGALPNINPMMVGVWRRITGGR